MKKKLEAELVSIAHRILQLKNKSDLLQLHKEAQNLYEKLSLLKFVEENFADAKPTIGYAEIESQIESVFGKEEEADTTEVPETKSTKAEKKTENKGENITADEAETKNEDKPEATEVAAESESPEAADEENAEAETPEASDTAGAETSESSDKETAQAETSEASETEEPASSEASDTAATEESKSSEEENTETASEERPAATDEVEIPETPEQPESLEEVQSALEYNNADEIEAGEEIPAAEDSGVSEAGETAPKEEDFMPSFDLDFEKKEDVKEQKQIAFEDFLGHDYNESFFVKAGEQNKKEETPVEEKHKEPEEEQTSNETEIPVTEPEIVEEEKPEPQNPEETAPYKPLSEHLSKTITIGLNDRIGFEKQLFGGSSEDLNRVLSQLNTFNTFQEAQDFIEDMVRPDYNWDGKDDYVQRFLDIVEKKFS